MLLVTEVYLKDPNSGFPNIFSFNNDRFISGIDLENILNQEYFLYSLTMPVYNEEKNYTSILTAKDFINSDCEFLLNIVDGYDISILCKNGNLLQILYQHVQELGYVDAKYLTESNSGTLF